MHEGQFTEKIVDAILAQAKQYPDGKILSVKVKVGEVYHLEPESVRMHFQMTVKGTSLEGARLDLKEEPIEVVCSQCHKTGPVEDHHILTCSFCYAMNVRTVSGNSITVESIEIES
jgi:hydrogenase nickel incorporation protein HypA/HybF